MIDSLEAPEFDAEKALYIVRKYQKKDEYVVGSQDEKRELCKALNYLFEGNAVYYKKRIIVVES
jgi:hypothetical protein